MNKLFTIGLILISFQSLAQSITGVHVYDYTIPVSVRVEGTKIHLSRSITRVESYSADDSTVAIDLYWKYCNSLVYSVPYDTVIDLNFTHFPPFNLKLTAYLDTFPGDEFCFASDSISFITDKYYFKDELFLSTAELNANKIHIYPNPSTDNFTIKSDFVNIEDVSLTDSQGKEVRVESLTNNSYSVSHLPNGMYFVKVKTEAGEIRKKLVLNH